MGSQGGKGGEIVFRLVLLRMEQSYHRARLEFR